MKHTNNQHTTTPGQHRACQIWTPPRLVVIPPNPVSAVAAKSNMRMRRWDFVAAYLQGELLEGEVVYCLPPPGEGSYATLGKDGLPMVRSQV